jgi:hypothetical protein
MESRADHKPVGESRQEAKGAEDFGARASELSTETGSMYAGQDRYAQKA